jgi:hypothetical protein
MMKTSDTVGVVLLISKLEKMRTSTHKSETTFTHINALLSRIPRDQKKKHFVLLLNQINNIWYLYSFTVHVAITHIKNQLMHFIKITLF